MSVPFEMSNFKKKKKRNTFPDPCPKGIQQGEKKNTARGKKRILIQHGKKRILKAIRKLLATRHETLHSTANVSLGRSITLNQEYKPTVSAQSSI